MPLLKVALMLIWVSTIEAKCDLISVADYSSVHQSTPTRDLDVISPSAVAEIIVDVRKRFLLNDHNSKREAMWPTQTHASADSINSRLETMNKRLAKQRKKSWSINLNSINRGRKSILSLGEGGSNFISEIRKKRREASVDENKAHAVDYHPLRQEDFYHQSLFQELNLVDSKGLRAQFDEIVSANALNFAVSYANSLDSGTLAVLKMLDHLKPDGFYRGLGELGADDTFVWKGILETLKEKKIIKDFVFIEDNEDPNACKGIVIKK
jgi:hypothetical protein